MYYNMIILVIHTVLAAMTLFLNTSSATILPEATNQKVRIDHVVHEKEPCNPALDRLRIYQRYGVTPRAALVKAASSIGQRGFVPASCPAFLSPVSFGNSTTPLFLQMDLGSSDLWVFSNLLPKHQKSGHRLYDVSSGTRETGETWNITYESSAAAEGLVYADKVVTGPITATSQAVEAATSVSPAFVRARNIDGVLGLALESFNTCKPRKCKTFIQNILPTLAEPVYTVAVRQNKPGGLTFGYVDESFYKGRITYVPVTKVQGLDVFNVTSYSFGNSPSSGALGPTAVDSGSTDNHLPPVVVKEYWSHVKGATYDDERAAWVYPCDSILPDFHVEIGGRVFSTPAEYINVHRISKTMCNGGIQGDDPLPFAVLGQVFLKNAYIVFKPLEPALGFANAA